MDRKHALVTGASSGIGAAIAARLLADGWRVTGADRVPCEPRGAHYRHAEVDLADHDSVRAMLAGLSLLYTPPHTPLHALVHAAGFMRVARLGTLDPADGAAMWRIHVQAAEVLVNAVAPILPEGARVVLIGSRTASGAAGRSQYAATKAALLGMARSWAAELAPRGITVNVVAPGATDTPMLRDPSRQGEPPKLPPIGRFVTPAEVAGLTAFLLGADGGAITGQQLTICGGSSL